MRYFRLWPRGNRDDTSLAFVRSPLTGLGLHDYCMRRGERIGDRYPADAKAYLDDRSPGIKLQSLLGNLLSYLMVDTHFKDLILSECDCEIEVLPFALYNHKKRLHSRDYWIINPIGTVDCVNRAASQIFVEKESQEITRVDVVAFDADKVAGAPDLFRVPEKPEWLFISEKLARAIKKAKLTNVILKEEIKVVPSK